MGNIDLLEDACADLPHATRRMFGGAGLFAPNGGMFAGIVTDDRIVLKFVEGTDGYAAFTAMGAAPWVWTGGVKPTTMREWLVVPDELYDEPRELAAWCARAHRAVPPKAPARKGGERPPRAAAQAAPRKAAKKPARRAAKARGKPRKPK